MSEEDKDLERLQAKRLAEMQKNISSKQEQEKIMASQKEQKDKKFLKETFGKYISPDLIDKMYQSKKIPELAKGLGKAMRELRDASNGIKKEIHDSTSSIKEDIDSKK